MYRASTTDAGRLGLNPIWVVPKTWKTVLAACPASSLVINECNGRFHTLYQGCGVGGKISDSDLYKISDSSLQNFRLWPCQNIRLLDTRKWNLAVKMKGNRGAQQEICFNKSFRRNCTVSTRIPYLRVWFKKLSNWTSGFGHKTDSDSQCC